MRDHSLLRGNRLGSSGDVSCNLVSKCSTDPRIRPSLCSSFITPGTSTRTLEDPWGRETMSDFSRTLNMVEQRERFRQKCWNCLLRLWRTFTMSSVSSDGTNSDRRTKELETIRFIWSSGQIVRTSSLDRPEGGTEKCPSCSRTRAGRSRDGRTELNGSESRGNSNSSKVRRKSYVSVAEPERIEIRAEINKKNYFS